MRFDLALAASEARSVIMSHCTMISVILFNIHCLFNPKSKSRFESKQQVWCILTCGVGATVCYIRGDWAVVAGSALIC